MFEMTLKIKERQTDVSDKIMDDLWLYHSIYVVCFLKNENNL